MRPAAPTLFVLDNYDSFTFNLVQMFRRHELSIHVARANEVTVAQVEELNPDYIVVSPGPKGPSAAGISVELIRRLHGHVPILGVCLGMQALNEAFGGKTVQAPRPVHGRTSVVRHEQRGLFLGVPSPVTVARYHSLMVSDIHPDLEVTAWSADDVVMGLAHRRHPLHGVQFHPESFLTSHGSAMIENFLTLGPLQRAP